MPPSDPPSDPASDPPSDTPSDPHADSRPDSLPDPPADMPADLARALQAHADDVHGLHEAILYAEELLAAHHETALPIKPGPGEEIVRVTEHEGYTSVVKRLEPGGDPYLYHVRPESHPEAEDRIHWSLVGRVQDDE